MVTRQTQLVTTPTSIPPHSESFQMNQDTFNSTEPILDEIAFLLDNLLDSEAFTAIRQKLAELGKVVGDNQSASLTFTVDVFDCEKNVALTLLSTGLSVSKGLEPFQTWGDSTPHRYVIDGQIQVVPHDHCPRCWGLWDFKFDNHSCPECDATLGRDCKVLLDTDVCPYCENGKVSMTKPTCDNCGRTVDLEMVTWG